MKEYIIDANILFSALISGKSFYNWLKQQGFDNVILFQDLVTEINLTLITIHTANYPPGCGGRL